MYFKFSLWEGDLMKKHNAIKLANTRFIIVLLSILILFSFTLVSCSPKLDSSSSIYKYASEQGFSQEGYLYEKGDVLWFYDFESGQRVVLCNKPDCQHRPYSWDKNPDPECNAVLPVAGPFSGFAMHDGFVYMFYHYGLNETVVYRQNPEGDGQKLFAEFGWEIDFTSDIVFKDQMAYFVGKQLYLDEEGFVDPLKLKSTILGLDLQTGKVSELTEVKDDYLHWIIQMQVIDDAVYYNYNYYDDEMELTEEDFYEANHDYLYSFIYKIDINTGVEEQVFDITECFFRYIGLDDKYIYLLSEDRSKVYSVNREDNSEKVLFEGESIGHAYKSSHYLIFIKDFSSEDGFDCYFYDLSTGKTTQVSRPDGEVMPDFIYEGWIVFSATLEDGTFTEVFMSIEDYLNGKTDYITIK